MSGISEEIKNLVERVFVPGTHTSMHELEASVLELNPEFKDDKVMMDILPTVAGIVFVNHMIKEQQKQLGLK